MKHEEDVDRMWKHVGQLLDEVRASIPVRGPVDGTCRTCHWWNNGQCTHFVASDYLVYDVPGDFGCVYWGERDDVEDASLTDLFENPHD